MITIDFETEAIDGNITAAPPKPVGVSIYDPSSGKPPTYHSWGHPGGNNTTYEKAKLELAKVARAKRDVLAHNAKFELSVLNTHFGIRLDHLRVFDTQYDIFLTDPYSDNLQLKPSAERILGMPPEEQDLLRSWIIANVPAARQKPSEWGAHIAKAPADLVGEYCNGDVIRTWRIFEKLHPQVNDMGMAAAYIREQRLLPILMASERRGIRVDVENLATDLPMYEDALARADEEIRGALQVPDLNVDSDEDLANALDAAGLIGEWVMTPKGRRSTSKKALQTMLAGGAGPMALLRYRGALSTCLGTFMRPWLAQAGRYAGRIHTTWNQVRRSKNTKDSAGTKTGRLSSEAPNFQNVPNDFEGTVIPDGYPNLPMLRRYLLPEVGHVWCKRDFASQEMRVAAHYAEGKLAEAYRNDPDTDPHEFVKCVIADLMHMVLPRKHVKITGFRILYGGGAGSVASHLGVTYDEGASLKHTYFQAMPEMKKLSEETKARGVSRQSIHTWGGRVYYAEPPRLDPQNNRYRDFSYKLLNYLIQGSSADLTKQSLIDWDKQRKPDDVFMAQVHDELNISTPEEEWEGSMALLKEAMNRDHLDVPMRSDGEVGRNWYDLEGCE